MEMKGDLDMVTGVLLDTVEYPAGDFSQAARTMLADCLPHALPNSELAADELHTYQKEFIKFTSEGLGAAKAAAVTAGNAVGAGIRQVKAELNVAEANHQAALKNLEDLHNEINAKTEAHNSMQ